MAEVFFLSILLPTFAAMKEDGKISHSYLVAIIALVFMILGYQTALFVHRAAVVSIAANRDAPDTIYVYETVREGTKIARPVSGGEHNKPAYGEKAAKSVSGGKTEAAVRVERKEANHDARTENIRRNTRRVESFRFDPNTVSVEELCRLGFSQKQAQSIDNYRKKGGRFKKKSDFAKSYVVSDSIFRRLEPYIDIPLLDLNLADSAALDALPGIGGWFARAIISHRQKLGGFSYKEQLMDIKNLDMERYSALEELVTVSPQHVRAYPLWTLPEDSLRKHPYIRSREAAHAIVLFRTNSPPERLSVENMKKAGILKAEDADRLSRCSIAPYP